MKRIFRVHFEDNGQDFLTWDIDLDGNVVACKPFQGFLWEKAKVTNVDDLKVGGKVMCDMPHMEDYDREIIHLIEDIEAIELPDDVEDVEQQCQDNIDTWNHQPHNEIEGQTRSDVFLGKVKKTVLRPQHDSRRNDVKRWKIAKKTDAPGVGWARFGGEWYYTQEDAQAAIDRIISDFPDQYEKEA